MKKIISMIFVLVMSLVIITSVSATEDMISVLDFSDMLTSDEIGDLTEKSEDYYNEFGVQFVVATVNDVGSQSIISYVDEFVEFFEIGGEHKDRVVLIVDTVNRNWESRADGIAGDVIDPSELYKMGSKAANHLSDGDYYKAFATFMDLTANEIRNPDAFNFEFIFTFEFLVAMAVVIVLTCLIMIALKNQLNTAKPQKSAGYYITNFNLFRSRDIYLYSNTTRTAIPKNSSSGGGGSSGSSSSGGSRAGGSF